MPNLYEPKYGQTEISLEKLLAAILETPDFQKVAVVQITYSGGGDNGDVDEVMAVDAKRKLVKNLLTAPCSDSVRDTFNDFSTAYSDYSLRSITDYKSLFVGIALTMLLNHERGWENEGGGQGTITFTLDHNFPKVDLAWDHSENTSRYREFAYSGALPA